MILTFKIAIFTRESRLYLDHIKEQETVSKSNTKLQTELKKKIAGSTIWL